MIEITLDTSCYDKKSEELLKELNGFEKQGLIKIWCEHWSRTEMISWVNPDNSVIKLRDTISEFKNDVCFIPQEIDGNSQKEKDYVEKMRGFSSDERNITHNKIDKILTPEGFHGKKILNKYGDSRILTFHILRGRTIFLTKDKIFFKKDRNKLLEKEFPSVKIRYLNEGFINELKGILSLSH